MKCVFNSVWDSANYAYSHFENFILYTYYANHLFTIIINFGINLQPKSWSKSFYSGQELIIILIINIKLY